MLLIWVAVLLGCTRGQMSIQDALCPRIYLHVTQDNIAQKALEGVYNMEETLFMDFPVYKSTKGSIKLYYSRIKTDDFLFLGNDLDYYFMYATCRYNPTDWTNWLSHGKDPFTDLLQVWFYYNSRDGQNQQLGRHGASVTIACVEEGFLPCPSGRLFFNETVVQRTGKGDDIVISIPNQHHFEEQRGISLNTRPVFKSVGNDESMFLFYRNGYWYLGLNYNNSDTFMKCSDSSFRPEYLSCTWQLYTDGYYQTVRNLSLDCHGLKNETCTYNQTPCLHAATCGNNSLQEVVCYCPRRYHGDKCQLDTGLCPTLNDTIAHSLTYLGQERLVGDIIGHVCAKDAEPEAALALCVDIEPSPVWIYNNICTRTVISTTFTTRPTPYFTYTTTSPEPVQLDDAWVMPTVITVAVFLQLTIPCIAYAGWDRVLSKRNTKGIATARPVRRLTRKETKKRKTEIDDKTKTIFDEWGKDLDAIKRQGNNDTTHAEPDARTSDLKTDLPEETREQLDAVNEKYRMQLDQIEVENQALENQGCVNDMQPEKKFHLRNTSFARILSIDMCVSFWLWLIFLIACLESQCGHYGPVFGALLIFSFLMIPLSYWVMTCESCFSRESQYLSSLGDVENARAIIERMREGRPVLSMKAQAWHMEQRTRVVSTTDGNGNVSSHIETYWVRVDTAEVNKVFDYGYSMDESDRQIEGVRMTGVTKIKMNLDILFGDASTEEEFNRTYTEFEETNRHLDVNVDFSQSKELPGFQKRVATYMDKNSVPGWMNIPTFGVMSCLGLTWVFRIAFRKSVAGSVFDVRKKVYLHAPDHVNAETIVEPAQFDGVAESSVMVTASMQPEFVTIALQ